MPCSLHICIAMSKFHPSAGPVTLETLASRNRHESYQAKQAGKPVGTLRLDWNRQGLVVETVVGHVHSAYMPIVLKRFSTELAFTGRLTPMGDFWEVEAYDTHARIAHTEWFIKHRAVLDGIVVVTQSKIVKMGVAVTNIAAGGILQAFSTRDEFDAMLVRGGIPVDRPAVGSQAPD